MNPEVFAKKLADVRELMVQDKYGEALVIIENLKKIEKTSSYDYNYNLIHQLYQLDSNCKSAHNQQIILKLLKKVSQNNKSITLNKLSIMLRTEEDLILSEDILRRELELLILRNQIQCRIDKYSIKF